MTDHATPSLRFIKPMSLLVAMLVAGCGGPTKTGIEARKSANDRFNRVGSAVAFDQAAQALEAGQFKEALDQIDRVVSSFPTDSKARLLRGRIVFEMGRLELAMTEFKNAAELDPLCDECLYYQGVVAQRWGRDEEAASAYAAALTVEPTNTHYLLASAETLLVLGRIDAAKRLVEDSACHFEFNSALAQLRSEIATAEGDHAQALQLMELAVTLAPDPSLYQEDLAIVAFHSRDWDRCLKSMALLPTQISDRADMIRIRARCMAMVGRSREARDLLVVFESRTTVAELITVDHDLTLGYIAWMIGDVERADICARRLMSRNPQLCDGYLLKGMILDRQGDFSSAVNLLKKAQDLDPQRRVVGQMLARAEAAQLSLGGVSVALQR